MAPVPLPRVTDPPVSDAEFDAQLKALDAERAALTVEYITSQTYPRVVYHATEPWQVIASDAEAAALLDSDPGWSATPVGPPGEAPVITSLVPDTVALGQPSFTVRVLGTGFMAESVIVWNGGDEVTTYVSATEVTTGVNMDTASAAVSVSVAVRNGEALSNEWFFTFTEAEP
jgi:hypothetical protein